MYSKRCRDLDRRCDPVCDGPNSDSYSNLDGKIMTDWLQRRSQGAARMTRDSQSRF